MDSESATARRHVARPGASQLVSAANCAAHLPVHTDMSGSNPHSFPGHGQVTVALHADQTAHPLSHVFGLRALREAAQLHARSRARVSRKNRRGLGRKTSGRSERAPKRSAATINKPVLNLLDAAMRALI